ncbi:MAG TPA: outer membrane protein transport protein [Anaerolineales bacterium]|nr:outer membrane protein transport protein [Anaerolineales bacterium]
MGIWVPGSPILVWENAWRYAVGVTHYYSDIWAWRAGIAYDQTPILNAELRTALLPDNNRQCLHSAVLMQLLKA